MNQFSSVTQLCLTLRPQGLQHSRLPGPSSTPRTCSHSCSLSWGCHPTNHLILCRPLLLLPLICSRIRVFSNKSVLRIRWPKYWHYSFSIGPSNEYSGLISFRIDCFDLAVQGTLKILLQHQFKSINSSVLLFGPTLTSIHDYWKNHSFDYMDLCWQSNVSAFQYAV